jgi:hypothetical protein
MRKLTSHWRLVCWPSAYRVLIWFALVVAVALTRFSLRAYPLNHGDEIIAYSVVHEMLSSGTLNTNWAAAKRMPPYFSYDQFNFSGYHMVLYFISVMFRLEPDLAFMRDLNGVIHVACASLAGLAAKYLSGSWTAASLATVGVGFSPELIQDSKIARADTFSTLLVLIMFLSIVKFEVTGDRKLALGISAALVGFSASIKLTFASFAPLVLLQALQFCRYQPARAPLIGLGCIGIVMFGFALGVPYGALHPSLFLNGVRALTEHYLQGLWPFGLCDAGIICRAELAIIYLFYMIGLLNIALYFGTIVLTLKQKNVLCALFSAVLLTQVIYFSLLPTFFARNFSHVIPPMFVAIAVVGASVRKIVFGRLYQVRALLATLAFVAAVLWFPLNSTLRILTLTWSGGHQSHGLEKKLSERCRCDIIDVPLEVGRSGEKYYSKAWELISSIDARLVRIIDFPYDPYRDQLIQRVAGSKDLSAHFVRGPAPARNSALQFAFGFDYIILEKDLGSTIVAP